MGGEGIEKLFEEMGLSMEGVSFSLFMKLLVGMGLMSTERREYRFTPSCWLGI